VGGDIVQVVGILDEELDDTFALAWEQVVRRHTALRTAIRWRSDGQPTR
jgi:hypothetical protein